MEAKGEHDFKRNGMVDGVKVADNSSFVHFVYFNSNLYRTGTVSFYVLVQLLEP